MTEIFKPVPGYNHYEVSNLGRVRSLSRVVPCGKGWTRTVRTRILKSRVNASGYESVWLTEKGKRTAFTVHTLVLMAFVGPSNGLQCCHGDGDPLNNKLSNLRWDTPKANSADRLAHGTYGFKITEMDVHDIRALYSTGNYTQAQVGAMFGIKQPQVSEIVNKKSWALV